MLLLLIENELINGFRPTVFSEAAGEWGTGALIVPQTQLGAGSQRCSYFALPVQGTPAALQSSWGLLRVAGPSSMRFGSVLKS